MFFSYPLYLISEFFIYLNYKMYVVEWIKQNFEYFELVYGQYFVLFIYNNIFYL